MSTMAEAVRFDMYAQEPPPEPWSYVIDEAGSQIAYRRGLVAQRLRPGWWPFAYADPEQEHRARRRLDKYTRTGRLPAECGAAGIRLAPDCRFYAWRNEYVLVTPDVEVPHIAHASVSLWTGGRNTLRCEIRFDMKAQSYEITGLPVDVPPEIQSQADSKGRKLVAFLAAACEARDGTAARPVTAAGLEGQREDRRAERIRAYCAGHGLSYERIKMIGGDRYVIAGERLSGPDVAARYLPGLYTA
jgi:hypothetical protein